MKIKSTATIASRSCLSRGLRNPPSSPAPPAPPNQPGPPQDQHEKKVPVTFLGVETSEVPQVVSEQLGLAKGFGLVVDYVVPDGPAAAAGLQQNDIIKMLNDQILTEPEQLAKLVRSYSEGTNVTLTVLRKGQERKITVKLAKREVPQRSEFGPGRHRHSDSPFGNHDFGDFGMNDLQGQVRDLKNRLGNAHEEAMRARDEDRRVAEEGRRAAQAARRAAGQIRIRSSGENGLATTNIDISKAQIVFSDDKGELRIENFDDKKVLTAKNPQGLLLFSGPVETKEDLDKVPMDVRQRFEKLQEHDLPAVISPDDAAKGASSTDNNDDEDEDETSSIEEGSTCVVGAPIFLI